MYNIYVGTMVRVKARVVGVGGNGSINDDYTVKYTYIQMNQI